MKAIFKVTSTEIDFLIGRSAIEFVELRLSIHRGLIEERVFEWYLLDN